MRPSFAFFAAACLAIACNSPRGGNRGDDDDSSGDDDDGTAGDDDDTGPCAPEGATRCNGLAFSECQGGDWDVIENCQAPTPICHDVLGCLACSPGTTFCDGNTVMGCSEDGMTSTPIEDCPGEAPCLAGECRDACDMAALQYSYLGCDFLAVSTANIVDPTFDSNFAVVVGNPESSTQAASVTVSRGGSVVGSATVQPGNTSAITLPMVTELKSAVGSVIATDAAYEVESNIPVVAYQYNPLDFEMWGVYSYTNDASLLMPEHTLATEYMVTSRATFGIAFESGASAQWWAFQPGFVAIASTADNNAISVVLSGSTADGNPPASSAGQTLSFTLQRGDVAQIMSYYPTVAPSDPYYCGNQGWQQSVGSSLGATYTYCYATTTDLTGTRVSSTYDVAVFGGHQCSFVPYDAWACDHLEEMMFPTATWGTEMYMTAPRFPGGSGVASTLYRVVALNSGTQVTFEPAVAGAQTMSAGQWIEFESTQDYKVSGTGPISVHQIMKGQDALGATIGDPAMGSGIPWSQVRRDYDILVPSTYTENFVNVVAPTGASVLLDGTAVTGFTAIGSTGYEVARVGVAAGGHHLESTQTFGITAYGYASYTSYLYPGGLNFSR
jgi:hypothetical protein